MIKSCLIVFVLFLPVLIAKKHDNHPEQVHISLGTDETEMIITWNTKHSLDHNPVVHFGLDQNQLSLKVEAETTHFEESDTSFYVYRALLTELKPGTKYYYQVGSKSEMSRTFHFKTLQSGSEWLPHLALYGDLGWKNEKSLPYLTQDVERDMYDAIFHVGDIAYDLHDHDGEKGDKFMNSIEPIASRVPYMTCPGNHEKHDNFSHYDARFSMLGDRLNRKHSSLTHRLNNHFYSLDIGPAHIVLFSTEFYFYTKYGWSQIKTQFEWLQEDLERANQNREQRPWIIVMGHRPFYCVKETSDEDCDQERQDRPILRKGIHMYDEVNLPKRYGLEELFHKNGVDLEIFGHEHFYARMLPMFDFKTLNGTKSAANPYDHPNGPVQITTGSAGNKQEHPKFNPHLNRWVGNHFLDYGYTRLRFESREHIVLEQVSDDKNGKVIDKIDVIKSTAKPTWMP